MKRIVNHTENEAPVIKSIMMLSSKTISDEDEFDIINNDIGHYDNPFQPGIFGGPSEVDISLSQTRIELENVVDDPLVTTGIFINKHSLFFKK